MEDQPKVSYTTAMTLGIKVGPQQSSIGDLVQTGAPFAEVWYRPDRPHDYTELFSWCVGHGISLGLHHWALTREGFWQSFAFPGEQISTDSQQSIQTTIDDAARIGAVYVNIHSGSLCRVHYDFQSHEARIVSAPVDRPAGIQHAIDAIMRCDAYARSKGVLLTVETTPPYIYPAGHEFDKSSVPVDISELSVSEFGHAIPSVAIANDFSHTAAGCISNNRTDVYTHLIETTQKLFPQTRLLHVGFDIDPYNGTDFHDSLSNPYFVSSNRAVPNMSELIRLLAPFTKRPDVYALVEPVTDHIGNYKILADLVRKASQI